MLERRNRQIETEHMVSARTGEVYSQDTQGVVALTTITIKKGEIMEQKFNDLTTEYGVSAREYFYVLRLAIYHVDGVPTNTSLEVARYDTSIEVYRCACNILNAMYRIGGFKK